MHCLSKLQATASSSEDNQLQVSPRPTTESEEDKLKSVLSRYYPASYLSIYRSMLEICQDDIYNKSKVMELPKVSNDTSKLKNSEFRDFIFSLEKITKSCPRRITDLFVHCFCAGDNYFNLNVYRKIKRTAKDKAKQHPESYFDFASTGNPSIFVAQTTQEDESTCDVVLSLSSDKGVQTSKVQNVDAEKLKRGRQTNEELRTLLNSLKMEKSTLDRTINNLQAKLEKGEEEIQSLAEKVDCLEKENVNLHQIVSDREKADADRGSDKIPEVSTRKDTSIKQVSPKIKKALIYLVNKCGVKQDNAVKVLHAVGNIVFEQNWTYVEKTSSNKNKRKAVATENADQAIQNEIRKKNKYSKNELPSHSFTQKLDQGTLLLSQKSIGDAILNSKNVSLCIDGTDHKRKHVIGTSVLVNEEKPNGEVVTTSYCIEMLESSATKASSLCELVIHLFRKLSNMCSKDETELADTQKSFAKALKFWVSDSGAEMIPACKLFGQWQQSMGVNPVIFIKCLAHVVLGFESEMDKLFASIESKTKVLQLVSTDLSASFLENSSKSIYYVVAYAIFRLVGKSSDSVSYSMTEEFTTYLKGLGLENLLCDIKQARFGKMFLVGRDLLYFLAKIQEFLDNHIKDNRLYDSVVQHLDNYPYLKEYSAVLGLFYFHIVLPFMRASGIEGDCLPLSQEDFAKLVPNLFAELESLSKDASPLLETEHSLKSLVDFKDKQILNFSKKDKFVFAEMFKLLETDVIDKNIVTVIAQTAAIKIRACLDRQVGEHYLRGEDSTIQKLIKEDKDAAKVAAVNNLVSERIFGVFKNKSNACQSAPTAHICGKILSRKSPYIRDLPNMPDDEFEEGLRWATESEVSERHKILCKSWQLREDAAKKEKLEQLNKNKLEAEEKRVKNVKECELLHGGPVMTVLELEEKVLKKIINNAELSKSINAELKYHKENIGICGKSSDRYKMYTIQNKKRVDIPIQTKKDNIIYVLTQYTHNKAGGSGEGLLTAAALIKSVEEIKSILEGETEAQILGQSDEEIKKQFKKLEFGAFCSIISQNKRDVPMWWIGKILSIKLSKECKICKENSENGTDVTGVCMSVRYMPPQDKGKQSSVIYNPKARGFHTRYEQVIKSSVSLSNYAAIGENVFYLTSEEVNKIEILMPHCLLLNNMED